MQLINAHRARVIFAACAHPVGIAPVVAAEVIDNRCTRRAQLGVKGERVGAVDNPPFLRGGAVFIQRALRNIAAENAPDTVLTAVHLPAVPAIEIADELHISCIWRIDAKFYAVLPELMGRMRAENAVGLCALTG